MTYGLKDKISRLERLLKTVKMVMSLLMVLQFLRNNNRFEFSNQCPSVLQAHHLEKVICSSLLDQCLSTMT